MKGKNFEEWKDEVRKSRASLFATQNSNRHQSVDSTTPMKSTDLHKDTDNLVVFDSEDSSNSGGGDLIPKTYSFGRQVISNFEYYDDMREFKPVLVVGRELSNPNDADKSFQLAGRIDPVPKEDEDGGFLRRAILEVKFVNKDGEELVFKNTQLLYSSGVGANVGGYLPYDFRKNGFKVYADGVLVMEVVDTYA